MDYKFRWNGGQEAQVKKRVKRAMGVIDVGNRKKEVWW